jgi:tetratricopeptide (TPR) repeat protein
MAIRRPFLVATFFLFSAAWPTRPFLLAAQGSPPPPQSAARASAPEQPTVKDIVIERLETTARFETDGTGEFETAARIRVLTDAAVQRSAQIPYVYNASQGSARFEHLVVHKPSGQTSEASAAAFTDISVQALPNVLTDLHQLSAAVPALAPGDVIDYRVVGNITHPLVSGHFWFQHRFTTAAVVGTESLTIDVPSTRPVQLATARGCDAAPAEGEKRGGRRVYRWTRSNPEAQPVTASLEKAQEGRLEPPDVLLTTFRSWAELGEWYLEAARDKDKPDKTIVAKAEELTSRLTTPADKLRALYEFVATQCRYLSLSFGAGALIPHPASEVLANRYGDCKDRHVLLSALARAVGIRTYPALISSSEVLARGLASFAQTDHMITVGVLGPNESDWVWLDSSSGVAPFGMIAPQLRDKTAVVLVADGPLSTDGRPADVVRLVTTPAAPPFPCFRRTRVDAGLSPVGTLDSRVSIELRGDDEMPLRMVLRMVPAEQHAEFLKSLARDLQLTGDLVEPSVSDPAVARDPMRLGFRVRQENWFDRSKEKTIALPVEAMPFPYADEKDWKGKDRVRLWALSDELAASVTIELPAGFIPKLPVDVTITRDYAQYRSTHRLDGSRLTVERVLTRKAGELPVDRMRDYLAFVAAVRSDEAQEIPLDTAGASPAAASADATPTELYRLGLSQYDAKDYAGALQTWRRVVALDPKHPDAWDAIGLAHGRLFEWNDAVQAFQEQVTAEPFHKQAWKDLGWALRQAQKRPEAIAAYRKQTEIVPLDKDAHRNLGELLLQDPPDYAEAASELARAEQITSDDGEVAERLGKALLGLGDVAKAMAEFERARTLSPGPGMLSDVAYDLIDAGVEVDRGVSYAKDALRQAQADSLKLVPKTATVDDIRRGWELSSSWHALGWAAFKKGDDATAERYLSAARSVRCDAGVSHHLSQVVEKLGRRSDAVRFAAEALVYDETPTLRERLVRLAGSEAAADKALGAARGRVMWERSAQFAHVSPKEGNIRFLAIFTNGSERPQVLALSHDPALEPALAYVRMATFQVVFPDGTPARVLTEGVLACKEKGGDCAVMVFLGGRSVPPIRRPVR